jgi:hypothetical protein
MVGTVPVGRNSWKNNKGVEPTAAPATGRGAHVMYSVAPPPGTQLEFTLA